MKFHRTTFVLTLLGILTLIFLTQTKPTQTGTIQTITTSQNKIIITLKNFEPELIIFDTPSLNLSKGDQIKFQGKPDTYKNKQQIIIEKIYKIN